MAGAFRHEMSANGMRKHEFQSKITLGNSGRRKQKSVNFIGFLLGIFTSVWLMQYVFIIQKN